MCKNQENNSLMYEAEMSYVFMDNWDEMSVWKVKCKYWTFLPNIELWKGYIKRA
jgi:hypothetical protein